MSLREILDGYNTEEIIELRQVGYDAGLRNLDIDIFVVFFVNRFGVKRGQYGYAAEWAVRFASGSEWNAGDIQSRREILKAEEAVRADYGNAYKSEFIKGGD